MVDRAGGFYTHRWGDACVHMLGVAALLPKEATLRLRGLPYWHQGTVVLPAEQRAAAKIRSCTSLTDALVICELEQRQQAGM